MENVRYIKNDEGEILVIVIFNSFNEEGLTFVTPDYFSLQMGIHNRKQDATVKPHKHNHLENIDRLSFQEMFYIIDGEMEFGIYDRNDSLFETIVLKKGDTILFNTGHSLRFMKNSKVLELKQGPYRPDEKKFI